VTSYLEKCGAKGPSKKNKLLAKRRRVRSEEILARCLTAEANKAAFENGQKMVKQIWRTMSKALTEDLRDQKSYLFLTVGSSQRHHAAETLGVPQEAAETDPFVTLVITKRIAFARQPVNTQPILAKRKRGILGYLDVVYTAERFEIFGVRKVKGAFIRNEKPCVSSANIDSIRPDSLDLAALYKRLYKMAAP